VAADGGAFDIAVAGGGPAGLAAAIACARVGLSVVVLEKRGDDLEKACGEGLLPPALAALDTLGARSLLDASESAPFRSLRYILEDGSFAETAFPAGGGRGMRRTALVLALRRRAAGRRFRRARRTIRRLRAVKRPRRRSGAGTLLGGVRQREMGHRMPEDVDPGNRGSRYRAMRYRQAYRGAVVGLSEFDRGPRLMS